MANSTMQPTRGLRAIPPKDRRTIAGGAIGTMMEYYDYYLFGLGAAVVFPAVFFPGDDPVTGMLASFASFAVGFLLRPIGGIVFGYVGDRFGRKRSLMITVIGMGICTTLMGLIPSAASIGLAAPILLVILRMAQGLFVGGEMGPAATIVVEYAPPGRRGLFGALLITGAGVANVFSAGLMSILGAGSDSFFMTWGWRIPFLFAAVLTIVAVVLRRKLEESEEFKTYTKTIELGAVKRKNPIMEALRHPKNLVLGIFIGLPQSIAGYVVLTFGLAHMVNNGVDPEIGFIGTMIVGFLQIGMAPFWGHISDKVGRRRFYILACIAFAVLLYPAFALFSGGTAILIWLGMIVGFVIPGVAMQGTLQTLLTAMFDVEARTTGVNVGYQFSNTLGGGFAPLICAALVAWAGSIWPVIVYAAVIALAGVIATAYAKVRPDVENAGRLHELG
ncbi:Predicted arabinose efflux permease, MFS family [Paramicrobacterium humi]|uniref:Predicted arabinose efflux permease, MFS family n=1 Tax=Paramicrobacterium humi TaxID=640635 RepID=A0A1H4IPG0_9MICO|nr:MFS transporter [Microbacterium humi]SEB35937.1 Predicted arabinose efflux permease, MFS family [Microbacterium humi]